jgi:hypothetical protein
MQKDALDYAIFLRDLGLVNQILIGIAIRSLVPQHQLVT